MAANVTRVKGQEYTLKNFEFTNGNTTDGLTIDFNGEDEKTAILVNTSTESTITIKAGTGRGAIQAVNDIEVTAPAGFSFITIDSGAFKEMTGSNAGYVTVVSGAATVKLACIELDSAPVVTTATY